MSEKSGALAHCDNEQMFKQCPLACVWMYERVCVCTGGLKQTLCVLEIRDTPRAQNSGAHHEPTEQNYHTRFAAERK